MPFLKTSEIKDKLQSSQRYWISFTGDSITSCEWVHPNWRDIVIYALQDELTDELDGNWKLAEWGIKGFNFAYDGATTKDVLERSFDILVLKPDLVISLMGGNDSVLSVSVKDSVENIKKFSEIANYQNVKVVWSNSTPAGSGSPKNAEYRPYADEFMKISDTESFFKIDMFTKYQIFPTENFFTFKTEDNPIEGLKKGDPDLQHPNPLGNAYIAKVILMDVFGIEFDPELYITDTLKGEKLPRF